MDRIRPAHEVVFELIEDCIATTEKLSELLDTKEG
jgi:hypothetical protein